MRRLLQVAWARAEILRRYARNLRWRFLLGAAGRDLQVFGPLVIEHPHNVRVGDGCTFGPFAVLNARAPITIGSRVRISAGVKLMTSGLGAEEADGRRRHHEAPIVLEDGCWIGAGAVLLPGVSVGRNSVVGAGAVVTKPVPPDSVAIGVPARVVGSA